MLFCAVVLDLSVSSTEDSFKFFKSNGLTMVVLFAFCVVRSSSKSLFSDFSEWVSCDVRCLLELLLEELLPLELDLEEFELLLLEFEELRELSDSSFFDLLLLTDAELLLLLFDL